jgi:O-antigen ligase
LLLALAGIYGVLQYFTLLGLPQAWWGNSDEPKRALSFFIHPNFYALWCAPLLALLIPNLMQRVGAVFPSFSRRGGLNASEGRGGWSLVFVLFWVIGAIGLLLSLSRAGWLGLAAALGIYLIVAADKKIRKIVFAAVIVIAIVIASVPNLRWRFLLPLYGEKSAVSRFSLWDTGIKAVKKNPVFGIGLTGFGKNWQTLNTDPGLTDTHNFPHNIFLDFWVETGLLGLISFIGLASIYIYKGIRAASPPFQGGVPPEGRGGGWSDDRIIKLGVALFLIAIIFQGLVDNPYFKNDLAMVFWIVLSLSLY